MSTETIKGIKSLICVIPGDLISNSDGSQCNKKAIWEEKCNLSIWKSLMQSEFGHFYQIELDIKALSITHPAYIITKDSYEKQYLLQRSKVYEKHPLFQKRDI